VSKEQSTEWRQNRTRLILKEGKDSQRAENYRPITIGSLLSRIYWSLMDERLRSEVRLTPRQKGFVNEDGCFNNIHTLNKILKLAKKVDGITIVQLDISKAFDTVPHDVIGDALRRKGIPESVESLISDSYNGMRTVIKQETVEVPIKLQRGVKQGDPLSPTIFNLITEPLLIKLEDMKGYQVGGQTVSSLAFADDQILLTRKEEQASTMVNVVEQYLEDLGMKLSAPKCAAVTIRGTKGSWFLTDPELHLSNGESIPVANANTRITYLGGKISPWAGLTIEGIEDNFKAAINAVQRSEAPPKGAINCSTHNTALSYSLRLSAPPISTIRRMDRPEGQYQKNIPPSAVHGRRSNILRQTRRRSKDS